MSAPIVHYIYDPLCGWCYAAGPLAEAILREGVPLTLHAGGLWDTPTRIAPQKRSYIRQADARIADLTGVEFGGAYLHGLLEDPDTILWSRPPTAAILAAEAIRPGAGPQMLHAIQQAYYVDGRRVTETSTLNALAIALGLGDDHARTAAAAQVDEHVRATRSLMARLRLSGFPGFYEDAGGGEFRKIDHERFYGRPRAFVDHLLSR